MNSVVSHHRHPIAAGVAGLLLSCACAAQAQDDSEPAAALQEVTVTATPANAQADAPSEGSRAYTVQGTRSATGLGLSLRDTPQAVTVITRQRIDDQAAASVGAALQQSTGVSINAMDRGRSSVSVRGFKVNNFQLDGMPAGTGNVGLDTMDSALFDRVEVVRGANGLLSGAGDPSAAINMVRKHATSKVFTGQVGLELGSWHERRATFDLSTPLNAAASVRARVVGGASAQRAFIDLERTRHSLLYGVIDADLAPHTQLSVGASDQRDRRSGVLWSPLPFWYSDGSRPDWPRHQTTAARWNQWNTHDQNLFATLHHRLPGRWTLRADINHRRQHEESDQLWFDGTPDRLTGQGVTATTYHWITQPRQTNIGLRATGPFHAWGREHELTVGLIRDRLAGGWTNSDPIGGATPVGDLNHWDGAFPRQPMGPRYLFSFTTHTQTALYAAARLQATDRLKFILGARLSNFRRDGDQAQFTPVAFSVRHDKVLTPYAGLVFDLNDALSAYASTSTMFNPQNKRDRHGSYLDPLEGRAHEVGLKGEWLDGRLQSTAALFQVNQRNFAVPDVGFFVPGTTTAASKPAQGVRVKGVELEVTGQPLPGWNLSAGYTQFSARDAKGTHVLPYHPRRLLRVSTRHSLAALLPGLSAGASLNWQSRELTRANNPGTGREEDIGESARALVGLMVRYAPTKQLAFQLNVDNLLDKTYRVTGYWGGVFTYGEPRKVLLSARYTW